MSQDTRDSQLAVYKVIIVGQSGVGKSNIVNRYVNDLFETANNTTIGVQFVSKTIQVNQTQVNLQIWDTAGQQRFRSVNKFFYKNAMGVLVVFSIACRQSFVNLARWLKQIRDQIQQDAVSLYEMIDFGSCGQQIRPKVKGSISGRSIQVCERIKHGVHINQRSSEYQCIQSILNANPSVDICFFREEAKTKKTVDLFILRGHSQGKREKEKALLRLMNK